jgi:hypothetical protein
LNCQIVPEGSCHSHLNLQAFFSKKVSLGGHDVHLHTGVVPKQSVIHSLNLGWEFFITGCKKEEDIPSGNEFYRYHVCAEVCLICPSTLYLFFCVSSFKSIFLSKV